MAGTAFAGAAISVIKRSKPCGLMRSSVFSMMIASAARTAASLTNSVREEPRKSAARSMIAMSCLSGRYRTPRIWVAVWISSVPRILDLSRVRQPSRMVAGA
jgi:ABC-type uncharacterized transport system permease subunit